MTEARPFSNSAIDRAGKLLGQPAPAPTATDEEWGAWEEAYNVLSHWRSLHAFPLSSTTSTLRKRALLIDSTALVAQRLKRFVSIRHKLYNQESMTLTQMQDIAGCRVVFNDVRNVYRLKRAYEEYATRSPDRGAELVNKWTKDYIFNPKPDGYRSVHLVMRYRTVKESALHLNGLRVEVQIRSRLQHAWAMAVETASAMTDQALKSGIGREPWVRFFRLMGSAVAMNEDLPLVPYTDESDVYRRILEVSEELKVVQLLRGMSQAVHTFGDEISGHHPDDLFVLELDAEKRSINNNHFRRGEIAAAMTFYASAGRMYERNPNIHVVLVSVGSISRLREAYPSYFLDTTEFVQFIQECCDKGQF